MTDFARMKAAGFVAPEPPKKIGDVDIPFIGAIIGVGEDEVHAIIDVEASGSGFDKHGRPKMLFEPHVFYRNLSGSKRVDAVAKDLAYKEWRPGTYPADSYPRLMAAMQIDETAALRSASWGMGQILGENHTLAGYDTPQEMVAAFCCSETSHLEAMINFIKAAGLDDELRAHNWAAFARGYNGPLYAKHGYHTKLAERFAWWSKKPDTPWGPNTPTPVGPAPLPDPPPPPPRPKPPVTPPAPAEPKPVEKTGPLWAAYIALAEHFGDPIPKGDPPVTIASSLIAGILVDVVSKAVSKVANNPSIPLQPADAPVVNREVILATQANPQVQEIIQRVEHVTNTEPWYRSRVTWGAIISGVAGVAGIFGFSLAPEDIDAAVTTVTGAVAAIGSLITLWGRWRARKPIGA